jgi:hypothetical protein
VIDEEAAEKKNEFVESHSIIPDFSSESWEGLVISFIYGSQ